MQRFFAILLLVFTSPILIILYMLIKLTSKGPFIYKQKRVGKDFKPFTIYKIRTMIENAERLKDGIRHLNEIEEPVFKIKDDPRYTRIGKILAYIGLDEILQLINIIKGDMSFVGPRPLPIDEAEKISKEYRDRFKILPGITSLWVVQGAHNLTFREWMESDLEYSKKKNWLLDLFIILLTLLSIIKWNTHILFLILYPLVLIYYAAFPDFIWWSQIFIFILMVVFLGLNFTRKTSLLFITLLPFLLLSTILSINRINSVPYLFSYLTVFTLVNYFREEKRELVFSAYVIGAWFIGLLSTIYSVSKIVGNTTPTFFNFLDNQFNLVAPYFGHSFYVIFLIAVIPYVLYRTFRQRISLSWLFIFFSVNIFLLFTFSKAGILTAFVEIALYLIFNRKIRINRKIFTGFVSISLSLLIVTVIIRNLKNPWIDSKIVKPSVPSRIEYIHQNYKIIKNSDWKRLTFGYGLDTFYELSQKYQSQLNYWSRSAHNFFIQFLIENGLIACLILIVFLIITIRENFSKYLLHEKITLLSLLMYSFIGTYDLNTFPILLLFFLMIDKSRRNQEKSNNKYSKLIFLFILFILIVYWGRYLYVYTNLFILDKRTTSDIVRIFPYETYFWNAIIKNGNNDPLFLRQIQETFSKYSKSNLDLEKTIITKRLENHSYCPVIQDATKLLLKAPFDLEIQQVLMESYTKCDDKRYMDLNQLPEKMNNIYPDMNSSKLFPLRPFLQFISQYYYVQGRMDEYQYWFEKAWNFEVDNDNNYWKSEIFDHAYSAFHIDRSFVVKIGMKNKNDLAGIALFGRLPHEGSWWKGSKKIFIGLKQEGEVLYIDTIDGKSSESRALLEKKLDKNIQVFDIYFYQSGRYLSIKDGYGEVISEIDINKETGNSFPDGLFPDNKLYLSYTVSPYSYLSVDKFIILPLKK